MGVALEVSLMAPPNPKLPSWLWIHGRGWPWQHLSNFYLGQSSMTFSSFPFKGHTDHTSHLCVGSVMKVFNLLSTIKGKVVLVVGVAREGGQSSQRHLLLLRTSSKLPCNICVVKQHCNLVCKNMSIVMNTSPFKSVNKNLEGSKQRQHSRVEKDDVN